MIYAHGTSLWHAVRTFGDRITTLCGLRLSNGVVIADHIRAPFLCKTCETIITRSPSVVGT